MIMTKHDAASTIFSLFLLNYPLAENITLSLLADKSALPKEIVGLAWSAWVCASHETQKDQK